jgi:hypothetical protein
MAQANVNDAMVEALKEEREEVIEQYNTAIDSLIALRNGPRLFDDGRNEALRNDALRQEVIVHDPRHRGEIGQHIQLDAMERPLTVPKAMWEAIYQIARREQDPQSTYWFAQQLKKDARYRHRTIESLRNVLGKALRVFAEYGFVTRVRDGMECTWQCK